MGKKILTKEDLVNVANKIMKTMIDELGDDEKTVLPADMVCVLAIMHRALFANIERRDGIEAARERTGFLIELVESTMKEGAWDEDTQCMK